MNVLVVGATGVVGSLTVRHLLERGHDVRVLVRKGSEYHHLVEAGAEACVGDLKDAASLPVACRDVSVVVTTANSASRGGEDTVETVDRAGNQHLIDAAKDAGVEQFIFVSAQVASLDSPVPLFRAKAETDAYLKASGLPYTILAPNAFADIWVGFVVGGPAIAGQPVTLVGEGKRKHSFVVARDVAAFASAVVGHPGAINKRFELGGPEAISFRDAAKMYGKVLRKEIDVTTVPVGAQVPELPPFISEALQAFEFFDSPIPMDETAATFGVVPTPLEQFVRESVEMAKAAS